MIEISWGLFKALLDTGTANPIAVDEPNGKSLFMSHEGLILKTYLESGSADFAEYTAISDMFNASLISKAQTRFERDDIRLKMSRAEATFVSGEAEVSFKLPGVVGVDKVFIGGGYAFTDVFAFGDAVEKIQIVDVDDILGFGSHTVIAEYHDETLDEANQGWFMYPAPQAGGEIEVDPMGFYGEALAGLYIELYFKASAATKVYVDFIFGRMA